MKEQSNTVKAMIRALEDAVKDVKVMPTIGNAISVINLANALKLELTKKAIKEQNE